MSNEQKLREALRETLLFCETFSNRWDGETGAHPFDMVERARQALATTEPEPTGMPEVKPWDHPEPQTMRWSDLEIRWIQSYGEQCWKAGYKHGAWGDKPAVNQQLTTDPFDEREAFEKWLGIKPCGAAHDFGWSAWQARAALAARKPLSDMDRAVLRMPMDMALGNDIGRLQYYQRVQGLLDRLDGIGLEVKQ